MVKHKNELKSERLGLLVKPSIAKDIKLIAKLEGTSLNNIANELLEMYVNSYKQKSGLKLNLAKTIFEYKKE